MVLENRKKKASNARSFSDKTVIKGFTYIANEQNVNEFV